MVLVSQFPNDDSVICNGEFFRTDSHLGMNSDWPQFQQRDGKKLYLYYHKKASQWVIYKEITEKYDIVFAAIDSENGELPLSKQTWYFKATPGLSSWAGKRSMNYAYYVRCNVNLMPIAQDNDESTIHESMMTSNNNH